MLVEREEEIRTLNRAFEDCIRGRGQLVIISGGVATGKTELVHAFAAGVVERGAVLLTATASRIDSSRRYGVLQQLLRSPALPHEISDRLSPLIPGPASATQHHGHELGDLCAVLVELSRETPLVIAVDDVQFADEQSLHVLLYLQRRIRFARVLVVLTEWILPNATYDAFRAEVTRQPNTSHVLLAPLSCDGVDTLLRTRLDPSAAATLGHRLHEISGGNPLLVNALVDDLLSGGHRALAVVADGEPAADQEFRHAVTACVYRWDKALLRVAQAVAVLGDLQFAHVLGELTTETPGATNRTLRALETAGLLSGGRYRSPVARAAVLDTLAADVRAPMHLRAAELLYQAGTTATDVAEHLVTADALGAEVRGRWVVDVLRYAAQEDLDAGRVDVAARRLDLAARISDNDADRAEVTSLLLRVEWHRRPSAAVRHLHALREAQADGKLSPSHALDLAKFQLWYGHLNELSATFAFLATLMANEPTRAGDVSLALRWLGFLCPPVAAELPIWRAVPSPAFPDTPWTLAVDMLDKVYSGRGSRDEIIATAEHVLSRNRMSETTFDLMMSAVVALLYVDAHERAMHWCEALLGDSSTHDSTTWRALLRALHAHGLLRRGDLPAAANAAAAVYDLLSPQGWGVAIGLPLAIRVGAMSRMGVHDSATASLNLPVPDEMFQTHFGLHYLYERGHHYLTTNRTLAALADFERCDALMDAWHIDMPAVVPWRIGAAEAHITLGNLDTAVALVDDHVRRLRPGEDRTRGMALRVRGAATVPEQRVPILEASVEILEACGDRFETMRSLAALGQAYASTGNSERASVAVRRMTELSRAVRSDATSTIRAVQGGGEEAPVPGSAQSLQWQLQALSEAELKVAVLAAQGHTNRAIGDRLYITVSTVEQHLTRVYRKLRVSGRKDLPSDLRDHNLTPTERAG